MARYATPNEKVNPVCFPNAFTRMMRNQPKYKWFKPILALLLFVVFYLLFSFVVELALAFYHHIAIAPTSAIAADAYMQTDFTDPIDVILSLANVIIMIPAAMLAVRITGLGNLGTLSSVEGRLRWDLIKKIALPLFGLTALFIVAISFISLMIEGDLGGLGEVRFPVLAIIAVILFVPLQCAAEEYSFRGLIFQSFGSWIPLAVISCIIQALCFGAMHGYNLVGNIGIVINGLIWGWLVVKTGGLEASICLHASNNVVSMLLTCFFSGATVMSTVSIHAFVFEVIYCFVMGAVAFLLCKRSGYVLSDKQPEAVAPVEPEPVEPEPVEPAER